MKEEEQKRVFDDWLGQYKPLIFRIVRAHGTTAADQDDLFQEIAIQVWNSIPSFRNESAVTTWLHRISLNTALKWVRKEKKHSDTVNLEGIHQVLEPVDQQDEKIDWLYRELYKLDKIDRSILLLVLDGFGYKEIGEILGITESNVGVKINRIKKYLLSQSKQ